MTRDEIIALIVRKATENGLVPWEFLGGAIAESNLNPLAYRDGVWPDKSPGLFQQTIKYADEGDHTDSPENIAYIKALYFDPVHACNVAAAKFKYWRYNPDVPALTAWVAYNSPGFYRTPEQSPNIENYRAGLAEAKRILGDVTNVTNVLRVTEDGVRLRERPDTSAAILYEARAGDTFAPATDHAWRQGTVGGRTGWMAAEYLSDQFQETPNNSKKLKKTLTFDPNTPTELQRQDWTCSIRSTMWMLKSLGIDVTPEEAQDAMSPQYVRSDVGLLDASGAGIVQVLRDRWGVGAYNNANASFDDVKAVAGRMPVAMGGRAWGHWTAVRGWDGPPGMERLLLANPGGTGPRYGQQTLNRQQFADLGPFSMVVVPVGG